MNQISLNGPCPCGSGKKFKRCCGASVNRQAGVTDRSEVLRNLVDSAVVALQGRDFSKASQLLDRALSLNPGDSAVLGIKGMVAYEQARYDQAEALIQSAIAIRPEDSRLFNFLGQVHLAQGRLIPAERAFGRAVTLDSGFHEAWYNLGIAQLRGFKPNEAIQSLERMLRSGARDGELHMLLAWARYLQGEQSKAELDLSQALQLGVDPLRVKLWLSAALRAQGKEAEADALESGVLGQCGEKLQCYGEMLALSQVEAHLGHIEEAERWLLRAISARPDEWAAYADLADVRKFSEGDRPLMEKMESILAACPDTYKRGLEFALGKVYSDIGAFDISFAHYQAANQLVRRTVPFDRAECIDEVTREITASSHGLTMGLPPGSASSLPVLIVGTPRSGTTLCEQIIGSHSRIAAGGELDFWERLAPGLWASYGEERARQVAEGYLGLLRQHGADAKRVTDKLPSNYRYLGIIHTVFPNAKIIHCRRHPIDACLSIYFQNFLMGGHGYKWDLESLALWYEQYQRLMAHWRAVLPAGTLFEVRYEHLVEDVEGVSRQMMEFLGLEWEPGQLDFHKQDRAVFTASKWQARQPVYKTSTERWRRYEKHLGPLLRLLKYA